MWGLGGLCRWPPNTFWMEMDNDGRRIDAGFNGNSTLHHSNMLHCRAQGHWQSRRNHRQWLLSFLPFLHGCLTPKLSRIRNQIHLTQPIQKENKDLTSLFDNMKASFVTLWNVLYSDNYSYQLTSTSSTCVNVPSALMFTIEPPCLWPRFPPLSWDVLCWEGKWMLTLAFLCAQIPNCVLE